MAIPLPDGLATPVLVADPEILDRNISRMAETSQSQGFSLRPHAKAHKCAQIANRQLRAGARGLSVATIGEAEAFVRAGVDDLFITYPVWLDAGKAQRLRRLADEVSLKVGVESVEGAQRLGKAVRDSARRVEVLVEVDSGSRRTGVQPAAVGEVGKATADAGLDVVGVFTFPGHGYGHDGQARERAARDEDRTLGEAAEMLRDLGAGARLRAPAPHLRVAGVLGDDRGDSARADRDHRTGLAQHMTGDQHTLGAVPAHLEEREREIAAQAGTTREQIAQLTARLDELGRAAEEIRIKARHCWSCPIRSRPRRRPRSCRTTRPTSSSGRCSPRPWPHCGRGRCARRWIWRSRPIPSTTPA
ncbi:alanine racemase [Streptomyces spinoverrucosus]|uniref:alanine racemase n=1 Tax=Streptomyces spinoverrucosus TaxID=284043 RepID=UPI001E2B98BF|nr:alanine racemase [Streptomyces spinoverrucosus]